MGAGVMKIYLDIFFSVNFLMNLLILEIMNVFLKKRLISGKSVAAAAVGAFFAVAVIVYGIRNRMILFLILYLIVSCLIIRIAYGKTTGKGLVQYIAGYYLVAVFTAGILMFVKNTAGIHNLPFLFLLAAAILILFLAKKMRFIGNYGIHGGQNVFPVKICYRGRSITGTGFLDTGNQLYEPVSHEAVTIVEYRLFQKMLTDNEQSEFNSAIHDRNSELFGKLLLRYIPFHSLGRENDFLLGVRADDMEIRVNNKETVHTGKIWLGIYDRYLSADGGYEVLLNSKTFRK